MNQGEIETLQQILAEKDKIIDFLTDSLAVHCNYCPSEMKAKTDCRYYCIVDPPSRGHTFVVKKKCWLKYAEEKIIDK